VAGVTPVMPPNLSVRCCFHGRAQGCKPVHFCEEFSDLCSKTAHHRTLRRIMVSSLTVQVTQFCAAFPGPQASAEVDHLHTGLSSGMLLSADGSAMLHNLMRHAVQMQDTKLEPEFPSPVLCRCMRKGGGIEFYNSRPLRADFLLWTFAYACMVSFLSVNLPAFDRPDTINPNYRDIRTSWCVSLDCGSYMKVHAHMEVMHGGNHDYE
jgi:hypothetical protein